MKQHLTDRRGASEFTSYFYATGARERAQIHWPEAYAECDAGKWLIAIDTPEGKKFLTETSA